MDDDEEYRRWYEGSEEYQDRQYEQWYEEQKKEKMKYLYLNFLENLQSGSGSRIDFYNTALTAQYEALKPKLGLVAPDTLQAFIASAFPSSDKIYYISMPAFDRRVQTNRRGRNCVYNIVIRPKKDEILSGYVPGRYDLIVIGDLTLDKINTITVKVIDLIDSSVVKFGEMEVSCAAACAFRETTFTANGRPLTVPDYGTRNLYDPVLTNDFVDSLCKAVYPIPDPNIALYYLDEWREYLKFRRYYLGKQSERCTPIDKVVVCDSYMISRKTYRKNEDYSALLLDGITDFARGEQVILSQKVEAAEGFPLIKVEIDKNRKSVLDEASKVGRGKPKFEAWLNRYTKDSMGLSTTEPQYDENGDLLRSIKFFQYALGERYLFTYVDIEPDCSELEQQFQTDIERAHEATDNKFEGIIRGQVAKFIEAQTSILRAQQERIFAQYRQELDEALESDISQNKDVEIKRRYKVAVAQKYGPIQKEYNKRIKKAKESEKPKLIDELKAEKQRIEQTISLRGMYIARNNGLIETKRKSLEIDLQKRLDDLRKEKRLQLEVQYRSSIEQEKTVAEKELQQKLKAQKTEKIENETVRRYCIYFRPTDIAEKVSALQQAFEKLAPRFLTYDNRAEKAKLERQEKALNSFLGGFVKNPYLPAYLFAPDKLVQTVPETEKEPDWYFGSLNSRQKTAVKRALASESLFLLQGPPGTGKTQVIAEITAQLCKRGKKVLISSETHKAIDNVFERLPKIPEIRPLRLIPSQYGKETNYSPEKLVDNFYANISGNLERQISRFEHFEETRASFDEEMKNLRREYDKLLQLKRENIKAESRRTAVSETVDRLNDELQLLRGELSAVREGEDEYKRTIKYIEACRLTTEGAKEQYIREFSQKISALLSEYPCFASVSAEKAGELAKADVSVVREELSHLLSGDMLVELQKKQKELRAELQMLVDPDTFEPPKEGDENYEEFKQKRAELIAIGNDIKSFSNATDFNLSDSIVYLLVPEIVKDEALLRQLPEALTAFQRRLHTLTSEMKYSVAAAMQQLRDRERELAEQVGGKQAEISSNKREYEELGENNGIEEYGERNSSLKQKITRFFRDFSIMEEYDSENLETAFDIIRREWQKLEGDYDRHREENRTKIPAYRAICKYLAQEDILEEDRGAYTRELFNNVNVFGITCTSRDRFTSAQLTELAQYGIDSVDIRTQGIDVVIVDEVSKSSFLDLLIPILYGKTVILVGDHRQLPPMYDLRHLRGSDFEELDEEIITKEKNDEYTRLYEECFFKTLYEKVPDDFRVMLNKQYRCHSHIMEVFNHFYGGKQRGLSVGKQQQDDEKQHNLLVRINGNTVIDPMRHIYFIDCDEYESSAYEGSTSKVNEQEAEVAITLLKELDKASENLVKTGKLKFDDEKGIDERPSAGIICTYGDQASLIKKKRKYAQFNGFSGKPDEKLIISTVDDFQGDERDIIIVSMVRNPAPGKKFDLEFIKKFERINVALSRARKLLVIVGSKKFLSENGNIDLPDMEGRKELNKVNYPVFREIIDTIYFRGRVLTAGDILGESHGE